MANHFIGAYLEPDDVLNADIGELLDFVRDEAKIPNLFFRGYWFVNQPDRPGGAYFTPHLECYGGTSLTRFKAPEYEEDLLQEVLDAAEKRGIQIYFYMFPSKRPPMGVPNYGKVLEVDALGRPLRCPCFNHPDYRAHLLSVVEDVVRNYAVKGVMWAAERNGPLSNVVEWGESAHCFCEHCCALGRQSGMDPERAKRGYLALAQFVQDGSEGKRPSDGYFVSFLRLLERYPEILAWNRLWIESKHAVRKQIYGIVKAIDSSRVVGWHIRHQGRGVSPIVRADMDYEEFVPISDFIKPAMFSNSAGWRFHRCTQAWRNSLLGDLDDQTAAAFMYAVLGFKAEGSLEEVKRKAFSPEYVRREVMHARERLAGRVPLYAGIAAITYAQHESVPEATAASVQADIRAAAEAGAEGIIFGSVDLRGLGKAVGEGLEAVGWV